jgi:hypothetical protein
MIMWRSSETTIIKKLGSTLNVHPESETISFFLGRALACKPGCEGLK